MFSLGSKIEAVRTVVDGKYAEVMNLRDLYIKEFAGKNLCGELKPLKTETLQRTAKIKESVIKKVFTWLVDRTGQSDISSLLRAVSELGEEDGYFGPCPKRGAWKGISSLTFSPKPHILTSFRK